MVLAAFLWRFPETGPRIGIGTPRACRARPSDRAAASRGPPESPAA